jgi:esterase/lipase superfamily enzyme
MQIPSLRPLGELLAELKAAVQTGNHDLATELERAILQRLATEAAAREVLEREVRAIMTTMSASAMPPMLLADDIFNVRNTKSVPPLPAAASTEDVRYPVWFGTNRRPTADGQSFTADRHNETTRGRVDVLIPKTHRFGETGSSFWTKLKRLDFHNDRLRVEQVTTLAQIAFFAEIQASMAHAQADGEVPQALVFLHGYNNTFEEAAIKAAQIGCDLKVAGATAFFSWPSGGTVAAYPADEAAIEASERAITNFLVDFAAHCGAAKIHLIAHSMGNRGLLRALQRISANVETRGNVRFGQIFLAAPDVDGDLFRDLADLYPTYAERTTLYTSNRDQAVHLSHRFHQAPRAGYFEPYTIAPGIDTVAVPNFDIDLLGHGYFAQAEALLHDMYDLMRHNQAPTSRQRLESLQVSGEVVWKFRR